MPDTTQTHDAFYRQTVTYRGSGIDFDLLWPPLERTVLDRLQARWDTLERERQAREREGRL